MAALTSGQVQSLITAASCSNCEIPQGLIWQAVLAAALDLNSGGSVPDNTILIMEASCLNCVPPGMLPYVVLEALRAG